MSDPTSRQLAGLAIYTMEQPVVDKSKPPIVLVHGAWHGSWCWNDYFVPHFVENGYTVHMLDLRGHSKSPARTAMRWNRISHYVDDVEAVIKSLGVAPVVIGHYMGGLVVQHLLRRDVTLAAVGLLATVPTYGVWKTVLNIIRTRPLDFLIANLTLSLYPLVKNIDKAKYMFLDSDTSREVSEAFQKRLSDESYLAFLDMLALALPKPEKQSIPMIVIGGENDTIFEPETQLWTAKRYDCPCHIVSGAPHHLMMSKHWKVAADLFLKWLGEVEPSPKQ